MRASISEMGDRESNPGEPASEPFSPPEDLEQVLGNMSNLFGELFALQPGSQAAVTISLEEASEGCMREVRLRRVFRCDACQDLGHPADATMARCSECEGRGEVRTMHGMLMVNQACPTCRGRGETPDQPCPLCEGRAGTLSHSMVNLEVPPGSKDGDQLRVPEMGDLTPDGPGDALVTVTIEPHPTLRRLADDLMLEVTLERHVAGEGGRVEIGTLDGPKSIDVAAGTADGDDLVLEGLGMPREREKTPFPDGGKAYRGVAADGRRGNLRVVFRVPPPLAAPVATAVLMVACVVAVIVAMIAY
jgi:molecular chaperone DnaJ